MSLPERFAFGLGTVVGIQARPVKNVSVIDILGMRIRTTNLEAERNVNVILEVDGQQFEIDMQFLDETLTDRTFTGQKKKHLEEQK